ncbi:hypothetical protein JCM10213_001057 [Rhodosporidiobolus nylandii]
MSAYIAKKVGRGALASQLQGIEPTDPHYESYEDQHGRQRRRKRPMPQGLCKRDEKILRSVRRRAHYLDKGMNLCGFRVGWCFWLALIPGLGDLAQFLLSYCLVLKKCKRAELPTTLVQRMTFNLMIGTGVGLIPLVGDLILATWKANSRNAALLEDFLIRRAAASASGTPAGNEERLAELAVGSGGGKIDRRTGEMVGGATPQLRAPAAGGSGAGAPLATQEQGKGGKKKWYGWGRGEAQEETLPR